MNEITDTGTPALLEAGRGYDPIEDPLRLTVRAAIEAPFEEKEEFGRRIKTQTVPSLLLWPC